MKRFLTQNSFECGQLMAKLCCCHLDVNRLLSWLRFCSLKRKHFGIYYSYHSLHETIWGYNQRAYMTEQFWKFQIPTPILNINLQSCVYTFVLYLLLYYYIFAVLRIDLRVSCMVGKHSTIELYSSPGECMCILKNCYFICMTVLPAHICTCICLLRRGCWIP